LPIIPNGLRLQIAGLLLEVEAVVMVDQVVLEGGAEQKLVEAVRGLARQRLAERLGGPRQLL